MTPEKNHGFVDLNAIEIKDNVEIDLGEDGEEILMPPLTEEQEKENRLALEKLQKKWGKCYSITADEKLFHHFCEQYSYRGKSFCEMMRFLIQQQELSKVTFCRKTGLNDVIYSNIMQVTRRDNEKGNSYVADMRVIMSICVGLGLNEQTGRELLKASGLYFCASKYPDIVYEYILKHYLGNDIPGLQDLLTEYHGNRINAINVILGEFGLSQTELLGSQQRPEKELD